MPTPNGIITHPSPYAVPETLDRLEAILRAKNIKVFTRVDHSGEAEKAGPLHASHPTPHLRKPKRRNPRHARRTLSAIDLPLKALAWQDTAGKVWLSYNDPEYLRNRFSLLAEVLTPIAGIGALIQQAIA